MDPEGDCPSAPECKHQKKTSGIPRPKDLRITRRVGIDGVVIAWSPLEHDCVAGFQVVVGGRVVQLVRSPHRTKALVTGLPFPSPFTIGLVAITEDGKCSTPAVVSSETSSIYKSIGASGPKSSRCARRDDANKLINRSIYKSNLEQKSPPSRISTPRRSSIASCS